ncbi:Hypothetical predicted protein [Marmota monax]|uniref:Uncharacterized protein n=1 Tax=Marmota monax TaxID=9995 RepID=A0A5E4BKK8_MARMO|nr:hypothetical protein GHT09_014602 [Marmota monax]VTJ69746.1 Hypothetical predicted protein [Marmota monax]
MRLNEEKYKTENCDTEAPAGSKNYAVPSAEEKTRGRIPDQKAAPQDRLKLQSPSPGTLSPEGISKLLGELVPLRRCVS